ncbi:MAG: hypothetical protein QOJ99_4305 [Bryobacterales bacterium]|jgi:hypothetical protein|nr:hypothetical protein [Bryobacterales bacterium]
MLALSDTGCGMKAAMWNESRHHGTHVRTFLHDERPGPGNGTGTFHRLRNSEAGGGTGGTHSGLQRVGDRDEI